MLRRRRAEQLIAWNGSRQALLRWLGRVASTEGGSGSGEIRALRIREVEHEVGAK